MSKNIKGYTFLLFAIIFEVTGTTSIKLAEGFTIASYTIVAILAVVLSLFFLANSLNYLPLSIAYAIWVGLGTSLIYIISIYIFNERISVIKFVGILMVIGGVVSLNYLTKSEDTVQQSQAF